MSKPIDLKQPIRVCWVFDSRSSRERFYQTLQYVDGTLSCNCPGWTRQVARDGSRTCKHCRSVLAGTADEEARSRTPASGAASAPGTGPAPQKLQTHSQRKLNLEIED